MTLLLTLTPYLHIWLSSDATIFKCALPRRGALITAGALNAAHHRVDELLWGDKGASYRGKEVWKSELHKSIAFVRGNSRHQQADNMSDGKL